MHPFNQLPLPPNPLVDAQGQLTFGQFRGSVPQVLGDHRADYRTPLGAPASAFARHFHYKQFQYFGIIGDDLLAGCAFAHTRYLGIAFFYIFRPSTGDLQEYTFRSPLGRALSLSDSPRHGESRFEQGKVSLCMQYREHPDGSLEKTLAVQLPGVALDARMVEAPAYEPMSLCTRIGINGWVYANKVAGVRVDGTLRTGAGEASLVAHNAFGHHDFSSGYMRRETFWNWACMSGEAGGMRLGLNLSCGVNETSFTENCLWLDDELIKVSTTVFDYDRDNLLNDWHIETGDGAVSLHFQPLGRHVERLNLGLFASNFNQLFGRFQGHVRRPDGTQLAVELYGFVEEQYAKW